MEANTGLAAFWELPFERQGHCLEGQSLWMLVHYDYHDAVTTMQVGFQAFGV